MNLRNSYGNRKTAARSEESNLEAETKNHTKLLRRELNPSGSLHLLGQGWQNVHSRRLPQSFLGLAVVSVHVSRQNRTQHRQAPATRVSRPPKSRVPCGLHRNAQSGEGVWIRCTHLSPSPNYTTSPLPAEYLTVSNCPPPPQQQKNLSDRVRTPASDCHFTTTPTQE